MLLVFLIILPYFAAKELFPSLQAPALGAGLLSLGILGFATGFMSGLLGLSGASLSPSSISMESWLALAYLILIANALAYFAWFRVIAAFPATVTGIGAMAVPVVGVLASAWLLDERLGWREAVALLLIISALATNLVSTLRRP